MLLCTLSNLGGAMTKRIRPNFTTAFRLEYAQLVVDKIVLDKNLRF
ncbi:MAG: hypothetical protein ACJA0N_002841 [Pseudohongiellaceae bacterium]|jgi:hypothetical protein